MKTIQTRFFNLQKPFALSLALGLALSTLATGSGFAQNLPPYQDNSGFTPYQNQQPQYNQYQSAQTLQGYVATAPIGSIMMATFSNSVNSEYARVGDRFYATLGTDLAAGGSIILPAGSRLEAQVVAVERAGRAGKNGEMDIRFTSATLPSGQRVPLSAKIQTEDGSGILKGGSTKGRIGKAALRTGAGAALGAALGTAMGPLSGGEVGRGAIYGTAVGGGAGALYSAWKKGEEVELPAGQPMNIVLDQPLTVSPGGAPAAQPQPYGQQPQYNQYQQPYNGGYGSY